MTQVAFGATLHFIITHSESSWGTALMLDSSHHCCLRLIPGIDGRTLPERYPHVHGTDDPAPHVSQNVAHCIKMLQEGASLNIEKQEQAAEDPI